MANVSSPRTELGRILRNRRDAMGLTQSEVAERAGLAQETVSAAERGKGKDPRLETLKALADALDLDVGELVAARQLGRSKAGVDRVVAAIDGIATAPEIVLAKLYPRLSNDSVAALDRFARYLEAEQVADPAAAPERPASDEKRRRTA